MDKVLVTGSQGFFASRFIEYYKDKYEVVALNHKSLDITDESSTVEALKQINPKYVVHAAAISDTGTCERNPELSYKVNVEGTRNIAKGCATASAKLFFLSSDQIYNGTLKEGPYSEEEGAPNTVYGRHKLEAEKAASEITESVVSLRLTWMFSLPERNKKINSNIVWNVVKAALKGEALKLPIYEYRGITYVQDLIENFNKIFFLPEGVYNCGSENNLTTYDIGRVVLNTMGLKEELLIKDEERFKESVHDLRISNKKLKHHNIYFQSSEEAIGKCIKDFSFKL